MRACQIARAKDYGMQTPTATPERMAVFTPYYSNVDSPLGCLHLIGLAIGNRRSSQRHDLPGSGTALQRIFQLLRHKRDHHLPPCTAVIWRAAHSQSHGSKGTHQQNASSSLLAPTRGSRSVEICEAFG